MRQRLISTIPLAVLAASCLSPATDPPATTASQVEVVQVASNDPIDLDLFGSCDEVLAYLKQNALSQVGPWGLNGGPVFFAAEDVAGAARDTAASPVFSTTNVQELGIDEPDLVKTDGNRIIALSGSRLHVIDVAGARPRLVGSVDLGSGAGQQMFLHEDTALVISFSFSMFPELAVDDVRMAPGSGETVLTAVDLSDWSAPRITGRLRLEGSFLAGRLAEGSARLVISSPPTHLPFVTPDVFIAQLPQGRGPADPWEWAQRQATEANRRVIINSTIEQWFPSFTVEREGPPRVQQTGSLASCDRMAHPSQFSGLNIASVVTIDLDREGLAPTDAFGLVTDGSTVYAGQDSLYIASPRWVDWAQAPEMQADVMTTQIHRFDSSWEDRVEFAGSGVVPGMLYSQWAMSEEDGFLRVASTTASPWWGWQPGQSQSMVTVLEVADDGLVPTGQISGLGRDEDIYAVRFIGDTGYVVTFRRTDPLHVIDLSDPRHPRQAGELEIPGYSAYLHPLADGRLLGVGQDADPDGRVLGTQVSVFDIADPTRPRRLDSFTLPGGYSEVEWDHHAFLYWPADGLTVIPVQQSDGTKWWSGSIALQVTGDHISQLGELTTDLGQVRRTIVVGDVIYSIADGGVMASNLDTLDEIATIRF